MNIVIDQRENALKEYFNKDKPAFVEYSQLPLGDIIIKEGDIIHFIIERKTLDDLAHSIKDGRYHEQKFRLLEHFPKESIIYLIEGTKCKGFYQGAVTNTICRDNIKTIRSLNLQDTINIIMDLYEKCKKGTFSQESVNKGDYTKMIKTIKKNHVTPFYWYIASLKNIPGVSEKIAQTIAEEYKTMMSLFDEQNNIVVGLQYGDEGKGKVVKHILQEHKYTFSVKANGGPNAGHTIYKNNKKIVLHQLPIGAVDNKMKCLIGPNCVIDMLKLEEEIKMVEQIITFPEEDRIKNRLYLSYNAHIIKQEHIDEDIKTDTIGSTKCGIRPAYRDK